jgi:hypothetical protein
VWWATFQEPASSSEMSSGYSLRSVFSVRVARDDPVEVALLERRHVLLGERLEEALLAGSAHVVAGVALAVVTRLSSRLLSIDEK